jgi:hypothetical protein
VSPAGVSGAGYTSTRLVAVRVAVSVRLEVSSLVCAVVRPAPTDAHGHMENGWSGLLIRWFKSRRPSVPLAGFTLVMRDPSGCGCLNPRFGPCRTPTRPSVGQHTGTATRSAGKAFDKQPAQRSVSRPGSDGLGAHPTLSLRWVDSCIAPINAPPAMPASTPAANVRKLSHSAADLSVPLTKTGAESVLSGVTHST